MTLISKSLCSGKQNKYVYFQAKIYIFLKFKLPIQLNILDVTKYRIFDFEFALPMKVWKKISNVGRFS